MNSRNMKSEFKVPQICYVLFSCGISENPCVIFTENLPHLDAGFTFYFAVIFLKITI